MSNILSYKGYHAKIEFSKEDKVLYGKIEGINDLVTFESEDPGRIEDEFHDAVDDYLEFCKEVGKTPDKEYTGSFNVRVSSETHKKLAQIAMRKDTTLNAIVCEATEDYVSKTSEPQYQVNINIKTEDFAKEPKLIGYAMTHGNFTSYTGSNNVNLKYN